MHKLLVNEITDNGHLLYAIAVTGNTIQHNMAVIYGENRLPGLLQTANDHPDTPFASIDKFHQFVVVTEYAANTGFTMNLVDFRGDAAAGLDKYLLSTQRTWDKNERDRISDLALSIESSVSVIPVELVVDNPAASV